MKKIYPEVPEGYGECPVCNGTGRMPCPDNLRQYGVAHGWYGYDKETDTVDCTNCGAQKMFEKSSGLVRLDFGGVPCTHDYTATGGRWRCTTDYHCPKCGDSFMIDSGD